MARLTWYGDPDLSLQLIGERVEAKRSSSGVTYVGTYIGPFVYWVGDQRVSRAEFFRKLAEMGHEDSVVELERRLPPA